MSIMIIRVKSTALWRNRVISFPVHEVHFTTTSSDPQLWTLAAVYLSDHVIFRVSAVFGITVTLCTQIEGCDWNQQYSITVEGRDIVLKDADMVNLHTLQWRHNERDGVSIHRRLWLFVQPFVQSQIKVKKHQSSASLAFVRVIHGWQVDSPHSIASLSKGETLFWRIQIW